MIGRTMGKTNPVLSKMHAYSGLLAIISKSVNFYGYFTCYILRIVNLLHVSEVFIVRILDVFNFKEKYGVEFF